MSLRCLHHRETRRHRIAAMHADQHQPRDRRSPSGISRSAFGNLMMYWAASRSVTSDFRPGNMIGSKNCRCHDPAARRSIRECLYPNSRAWASTDLVEAFFVQTPIGRTINILYCIAFHREYWCRRLQADFCRQEVAPRLTSLAMERALAVAGAFSSARFMSTRPRLHSRWARWPG
jgi:hypothetical protein